VFAEQLGDLHPICGDQSRVIVAGPVERRRAKHPRSQRLRERGTREAYSRGQGGGEKEGDEEQQPDPLDRRLPPFPPHGRRR
jgi:hypothetical protein